MKEHKLVVEAEQYYTDFADIFSIERRGSNTVQQS